MRHKSVDSEAYDALDLPRYAAILYRTQVVNDVGIRLSLLLFITVATNSVSTQQDMIAISNCNMC